MGPQRSAAAEFFTGVGLAILFGIVLGVLATIAAAIGGAAVMSVSALGLIGSVVGVVMAFVRGRPVLGAGVLFVLVLPMLAFGACLLIGWGRPM